jgi:hypothetical protein
VIVRIVGKVKLLTSAEDRWNAGIKASELAKSLKFPEFREPGIYRGTQSMFDQMDEDRLKLRQRWLNEHST